MNRPVPNRAPGKRVPRWLRAAGAAVLWLGVAALAPAATLVAANGDTLRGRWVETRDGYIVFDSDAFGRIRVAQATATVRDDDAPDPATATPSAPSAPATPAAPAAAAAPAPAAEPASPWRVDVGLKLGADRGSLEQREDEVDATLRFVRASDHGELNGNLSYGYTRTEGRLKDDDASASLSYDRWLPSDRFVSGRVIGSSDLIDEGYDRTRTLSVAYGWRLFEAPERYLRIGPAVGYLWLDRGAQHYDGTAYGLYARAKGPLLGSITYTGELQLLDSLDDGRYANLDFRLEHPITDHVRLALAWRYVWSDVNIETGISSEWRWEIAWRPRLGGAP